MAAEGKKYDDATWHSDGEFPEDLPEEAGGTHIGMFLAWALLSGLGGDFHAQESAEGIAALRDRSTTPGAFLFDYCDGRLTDEDLGDEGNAFAHAYFERKSRGYLLDYEQTLGGKLPNLYAVPDDWKSYDRLSPVLDRRLSEWRKRTGRATPSKPWWKFW